MPGLLHMFLYDTFLEIPHNDGFAFNDSQIRLMFNKVNDARLGFTPEHKVLRLVDEFVGFGVFGGLEDLVDLDRVGLVVVLDPEEEDRGEQEVEDDADDEDRTAEEFAA